MRNQMSENTVDQVRFFLAEYLGSALITLSFVLFKIHNLILFM